jgi:NAD-dependent DNA ligase
MIVGSSGFDDKDRSWIGRIASLLGCKFTEQFSRANTHLLVNEPVGSSMKVTKAKEWGKYVLSETWLSACLEAVITS